MAKILYTEKTLRKFCRQMIQMDSVLEQIQIGKYTETTLPAPMHTALVEGKRAIKRLQTCGILKQDGTFKVRHSNPLHYKIADYFSKIAC